jgi:starch synthase
MHNRGDSFRHQCIPDAATDAIVVNAVPVQAGHHNHAERQRSIGEFTWARVAEQTLEIYRKECT